MTPLVLLSIAILYVCVAMAVWVNILNGLSHDRSIKGKIGFWETFLYLILSFLWLPNTLSIWILTGILKEQNRRSKDWS